MNFPKQIRVPTSCSVYSKDKLATLTPTQLTVGPVLGQNAILTEGTLALQTGFGGTRKNASFTPSALTMGDTVLTPTSVTCGDTEGDHVSLTPTVCTIRSVDSVDETSFDSIALTSKGVTTQNSQRTVTLLWSEISTLLLNPAAAVLPLDGTEGQVLTHTNTALPEWADPVKELPSVGTAGQVLTYGESPVWADPVKELPEGGAAGKILAFGESSPLWITPTGLLPEGGAAGKILAFGESSPLWATPPSGLPEGGAAGKILAFGESPVWADPVKELPEGGASGKILAFGESSPLWITPTGLLPEGGEAGQVLLYGSGSPVWAAAPSGLPEGGETGQVIMYGIPPIWVTPSFVAPTAEADFGGNAITNVSEMTIESFVDSVTQSATVTPTGITVVNGAATQTLTFAQLQSKLLSTTPFNDMIAVQPGFMYNHTTPLDTQKSTIMDFTKASILLRDLNVEGKLTASLQINDSALTLKRVADNIANPDTIVTLQNSAGSLSLTDSNHRYYGGVESDKVDGDTTSYTFPSNMNLLFRLNIEESNTTPLHYQLPSSGQPLQTIEIHSHGCLTSTFGGLGISITVALGRTVTTCVYISTGKWTFSQKPLGKEGLNGQVLTKIGGGMAWTDPVAGEILDPDTTSNYTFPDNINVNYRLRISRQVPSENTNPINVSLPSYAQNWQKIEIYSDYLYSILTVNNSTLNLANMLTTCTWADKWYFTQTPFVQPVANPE
jgi:hypothetical protein